MPREVCKCEAYDFPHRMYGGKCYGHNLADCPCPDIEVDPYGTGDTWYRTVEHGCRGRVPLGSLGRELDDYLTDWRETALSAARP